MPVNDFEHHILRYSQLALKHLVYYIAVAISFSYSFCNEHPVVAYWLGVILLGFVLYRFVRYVLTLIKRFALFIVLFGGYLVYQRGFEAFWNKDIPTISAILATNRNPHTLWTNLKTYIGIAAPYGDFYKYMLNTHSNFFEDAIKFLRRPN
ncbi:HDL094Cp [Eremothecium sinecaudum]|uniref:HDL094Cp n=1 Tax=Eremothecium sinecaudum TaxID=45286 RepID=A0A0X8HSG8_9SACH|nr:HDL094Cp [Eremothecium sinecaudum]AMD20650.1 HDL094Cp [Eremothecium sinecaudum]